MNCYVRFFNSIMGSKDIKVMMGDVEVTKALDYPKFTEYFKCMAGKHEVKIYKGTEMLYKEAVYIKKGDILTLCIAGSYMFYDIFPVLDRKENHSNTVAEMRFVNLVPFDTKYNVYMDTKKVVEGLNYRDISGFTTFSPRNYRMIAENYYTEKPAVIHPSANIKPNYIYTTYVVGNEKDKNGLLLVNSLEGSTYIVD